MRTKAKVNFKKAKRTKDSQYAKITNMDINEFAKWLCRQFNCFDCPMYEACDTIGSSETGWRKFLESEVDQNNKV